MSICTYQYKGQFYTAENLRDHILTPTNHEEVFWEIHKDQLDEIKSLSDNVTGFYAILFKEETKQATFEAAVQANSSPNEKKTTVKAFGQRIVDIAQSLFPTAQAGDTYEQAISSFIIKTFSNPNTPNGVSFKLRLSDALSTTKAEELFKRFYQKGNKDKFYAELVQLAGAQQVDLLRTWNEVNKPSSVAEMATGVAAEMTYTIEINTAKSPLTEMDRKAGLDEDDNINTSYYANLTVPGGTNYTENEIATPAITPAIKGHAQFSTDQGIGWFRSDEQITLDTGISDQEEAYYNPDTDEMVINDKGRTILGGKTRRILEVQSDLFQKGRNQKNLTGRKQINSRYEIRRNPYGTVDAAYGIFDREDGDVHDFYATEEEATKAMDALIDTSNASNENTFLQLLNKDNNWVTFFIKSIVQDSAKKGYEKVLFPTGETASKIEGHTTLEEFKRQKEDRIKELERRKKGISEDRYDVYFNSFDGPELYSEYQSEEEANRVKEELNKELSDLSMGSYAVSDKLGKIENEINQLKQELERVEREGFGALRPIFNFYETTIGNILKKQYGKDKINRIKDEYGNEWYELDVNQTRDVMPVVFNKIDWEQELISRLQNHEIIGKKKYNDEYWLKKTSSMDLPGQYRPEDVERRNLDKIRRINDKIGYEAVTTRPTSGGYIVRINTQPPLINNLLRLEEYNSGNETIDLIDKQIFESKDNPITTDVLANVATMARDLGRQDLVETSRFIYNHIAKNATLRMSVPRTQQEFLARFNQANNDQSFEGISGGFYDPNTNSVTINKQLMGIMSVETNLETILEELMHGITGNALYPQIDNSALAIEYREEISKLYTKYKRLAPEYLQKDYRFSNHAEFIVGLTVDKTFRERLTEEKLPALKRIWRDFMNAVRRLLRLPTTETADPRTSMFEIINNYINNKESLPIFNSSLKEGGRRYDLNFSVVPNSVVEEQKKAIENKLTPEYTQEFKNRIRKLVDFLRSTSSTKSSIDADDNFFYMFKQSRKLQSNIIDEIDYLFSFLNEFSAITELAVRKMRETRDSNQSREEKIKNFTRTRTAVSQYFNILKELQNIKENMLVGTPIEKVVNDIISNSETVESLYNDNILPLVSNKVADLAAPAKDLATIEQNEKIDRLEKFLEGARKRGQTQRVKILEEKIKKERKFLEDKLNITPEKAHDVLTGLYGDSNALTSWLESAIVNPNVAVSSVAKATTDAYASIAPLISANNNQFQTAIESYAKNSGRNINNIEEFTKPFIETVKVVEGKKEDGSFELKEKLALVSPYNLEYIQELQKFTYQLNDLSYKISRSNDDTEKANYVTQRDKVMKDRRQFMKDYMEQPYTEEVHEAMEILDEDLGGFTAREEMNNLYDLINIAERALENAESDAEVDALLENIDALNFEIKRLRYEGDKTPGSKGFIVAEQLKKYDEAMKEFREFRLTPKKRNQFLAAKQRIDDLFAGNQITEKERNHWYQTNTITEYKQAYWDEKKAILDELQELREKFGVKSNEDINKLYKNIEAMVKAYRDNNGVINGRIVPAEEAKIVKETEEIIERIKETIPGIDGLTSIQKARIQEIGRELDDIEIEIASSWSETQKSNLALQQANLEAELDSILSSKNNISKRELQKYFDLVKKLSELDKTEDTVYYQEEREAQINNLMNGVQITALPHRFKEAGIQYSRQGDIWVRIVDGKQEIVDAVQEVEQAYKHMVASERLEDSQWFIDNHVERNKYVPNPDFDPAIPGDQKGWYEKVMDPIYIWRHTSPKIANYISTEQPSFKYKTSVIKSEFHNPRYKTSIDGYNVPKLQGAKDDRFVNKNYLKLSAATDEQGKATFKALNFLTDKYREAQSHLPVRFRPGYFLPSVRKSGTERTLATKPADVVEKVKGAFTVVKEELAKNDQDKDILFGYTDTMTSVPMKYIGDIDVEDQTRDIFQSILMFSSESIKRKGLMDALPFVLAVRNIVSAEENKPVKLDSKGSVITLARKVAGNRFVAKLIPGESQTSKQIDEFIRSYYFGEIMKDEIGAKPLNTILGLGAKALLGMNYSASVVNRMNAWTQSFLETESKRGAFTRKEMMKAQAIYTANIKNFVSDIGKYGNKSLITQMFDYFGGANYNIVNKQNKTLAYSRLVEGVGKLLIPNEMAEHAISYNLFISMALKHQVPFKDKMIPLFEAFEIKNGVLRTKEGVVFTERDRAQFINRMNGAARRINGAYGMLDKVQAHKYAMGRLLLFMNNYFVPFLTRRFGNQRFSMEDGITDQGYWRTFGMFLKDLGKGLITFNSDLLANWKYYTEQERVAIARAATEISFSLTAIGLIAALGGDEPEDVRENAWWQNSAIYTLKMFRRQNEQFMLIPGLGLDDIYQKIKSPFPIAGKIGNAFATFNHMAAHLGYYAGLDFKESDFMYTRKSGWHQPGDLKIMTDLSRLFGFTYRISQMQNPEVAVANMDAYRIK